MPRLYFIFIVVLYLSGKSFEAQSDLKTRQENYEPLELEDQRLSIITKLTDQNHFDEVLNNILVERIVGTQSHENVKNYIKEAMTKLNWDVELDEFQDTTPNMGVLTFTNIIATLNPNAERFLLLACHYDSKYFPNGDVFLGATDSAVPCAMMINLAHSLREYLESNRQNNDVSIKLVFFDGEEAFQAWGPKDSIYGARHLAAKWERENFLPRIDMLVLLDLLGAPKPTFYSFFQNTEKWYGRLFSAETRLADIGLLERYTYSSATAGDRSFNYFKAYSRTANIEDDHIPFLQRNVPILHIIPTPFPAVWHEIGDDKDAIDFPTIENLNKIFRIFLVEYLHLIV